MKWYTFMVFLSQTRKMVLICEGSVERRRMRSSLRMLSTNPNQCL